MERKQQMNEPNLFSYATKELSQDAVICWLIEWSQHDGDMGHLGRRFVETLLNHKRDRQARIGAKPQVEIIRQDNGIDILARIDSKHVLLIEDKIDGEPHSDQLARYRKAVLSGQTELKEVSEDDLVPIYFKTGNQSRGDATDGHREAMAGYTVFDRPDLMAVLGDLQSGTTQSCWTTVPA